MNKKNKIIIIGISLVIVVLLVFVIFSLTNNDAIKDNSNPDFVPTLLTDDAKDIKQNGEKIEENDEGITYKIVGNYENFKGYYEYIIDKDGKNVSYAAFITVPAKFDIQLFYDDITQEEKDRRISEGYANYTKDITYIIDTLKYEVLDVYKIMFDGNFEKLEMIPTAEQLKSEFVNSEIISCYVVNFKKPNGEKISLTISTEGWNSISLIFLDNTQSNE